MTDMRKKIIPLVLCVIMLFSLFVTASAQEDVKIYTLSLEDAIKMATQNDPALLSADTAIKNTQRQLEQAYKDQRNMKGAIPLPAGLANAAVKQGYYVEQAKIGVESANLSKKQLESRTSYTVTQSYYSVKFSEEMLKTAQSAYELALNNKKNVDIQFSLGMVSQLDVKNAQYSVNETQAMLNKNIRNFELSKKSLAASLSIEEDNVSFVLTDDIEYEEFSSDLADDTEKALESRYDIYQIKSNYLQAERYTHTTILLGSSSSQHSAANQAMVQAEATYNNSKKQIAISINSTYNNILDSKDSLMLAQENLAIRQQEYDVAVIQYDIGMITNSQLVGVMNTVTNAKIQLDNAKLSYKLAVEKYRYEISIGLGI